MELAIANAANILGVEIGGDDGVSVKEFDPKIMTQQVIEQHYHGEVVKTRKGYGVFASFIMTKVPNFIPRDHQIVVSAKQAADITAVGTEIIAYLLAISVKEMKVNSSNVVEFLCAQNQRGVLDLSYKDSTYSIAKVGEPVMSTLGVQNCFPQLTGKNIDSIKELCNINNFSVTSAASASVAVAVVSSVTTLYKDSRVDNFKMKSPPSGMSCIPALDKAINNPWVPKILPLLKAAPVAIKDETDVINFVSQVVTLAGREEIEKFSRAKKMQESIKTLEPKILMKKSYKALEELAVSLKPTWKKMSKIEFVGNGRVSSVVKMIPPLQFLASSFDPVVVGKKRVAIFMGAMGGAHYRAVSSYFDIAETSYDIVCAPVEHDIKNGLFPIKQADFFTFDYNCSTLIEDVYCESSHRRGKDDAGLHKKASCLLKFKIFNVMKHGLPDGRDLPEVDNVMVKCRLPSADTIHYYDGAYPFIACKTSHVGSKEFYAVKTRDPMVSAFNFKNVMDDNDKFLKHGDVRGSRSLKVFCSIIHDKAHFLEYARKQTILRVVGMFALNQIPILHPLRSFQLPITRDWLVLPCCMPITYLPKKKRRIYGTHLLYSSNLVDAQDKDYEKLFLQDMGNGQKEEYDEEFEGHKKNEDIDDDESGDEGDFFGRLGEGVRNVNLN